MSGREKHFHRLDDAIRLRRMSTLAMLTVCPLASITTTRVVTGYRRSQWGLMTP